MNGRLRHGAKHRAKVAVLRDRFPQMVTRRFKINMLAMERMHVGDFCQPFTLPKGATYATWWDDLQQHARFFEVTLPHHRAVVYDPKFVEPCK